MTPHAVITGAGLLLALVTAGVGGCETYRIEHHHRPAFHKKASMGELPDRVVLEDGTVIVYEDRSRGGEPDEEPAAELFRPREDFEDGTVILRALKPEHVLVNVLGCLQNNEYEVLWEQMLSERTRQEYERLGQGYEDFARYFTRNRKEIARTMKRMLLGMPREEVRIERVDREITTLTLRSQIAAPFKYTRVAVIQEGPGLKLLVFR